MLALEITCVSGCSSCPMEKKNPIRMSGPYFKPALK